MGPDPVEIAADVSIVVLSIGGMTVLVMFARALMQRSSHPKRLSPSQAADGLRRAVEQLTLQVGDLHERLDFTERVLASRSGAPRLGDGA